MTSNNKYSNHVSLIYFENRKIYYIDYRGFDTNNKHELFSIVDYVVQVLMQGEKNKLAVFDFNDTFADSEILSKMKSATEQVKPYMGKMAVLGITGMKSVLLKGVNLFAKTTITPFNSLDEAKKFLVRKE